MITMNVLINNNYKYMDCPCPIYTKILGLMLKGIISVNFGQM